VKLFVCRYEAVISHFLKTAQKHRKKVIPFSPLRPPLLHETTNGKKLKHFFLVACFSQINYAVSFFGRETHETGGEGRKKGGREGRATERLI
jgi:hypothetical protein